MPRRICFALLMPALMVAPGAAVMAQEAPAPDPTPATEQSIHWAYSAFLGSGWYQVRRDLEVFVLRAPLSWRWRETDPAGDGWQAVGVTFDFPLTFGLYQFDLFDDPLDPDNFGTVSFTPGVELEWSPRPDWWLRAYAHGGWGVDTANDEQAWMWDLGLRSRYVLRSGARPWGLFSEVFTAGYRPDNGPSSTLGGLGAGLDYRHPVSWTSIGGDPLDMTWDLAYRWYGDELNFNTRTTRPATTIKDEWRLGLALALRERRWQIWFLEFDQMGLAYRVSSDGEFRGLTVNVSGSFRR